MTRIGGKDVSSTIDFDRALLQRLPLELRTEIEENLLRLDFSEEELAHIQRDLIAALSPPSRVERRKRKSHSQESISGEMHPLINESEYHSATDAVAKLFREDRKTVQRRVAVVNLAEQEPEKYGKVLKDMNRTGNVNGAYKELGKIQDIETILREPPPLPGGPFRVIMIDPAWPYEIRSDDLSHRSANPYQSMPLDQILALPIASLAEPDCILWLWTTNAFLPDAFDIIKGWGFEYKNTLIWAKTNRIGTGDNLRGQTEPCLLAFRGKPVHRLNKFSTLLSAPAGRHSEKPEEFYAMVEEACPGSKLEMFARRRREGWTSHGHDLR
jgi:N6-adenosine-specific RNA methylase IME4